MPVVVALPLPLTLILYCKNFNSNLFNRTLNTTYTKDLTKMTTYLSLSLSSCIYLL